MTTMYPADNIGKDGKSYPTVGENIRNAVTAESVVSAVDDNTDRAKMCNALDVTATDLKTAIINLLTGKTVYFGGLDTDALTAEELTEIKTYLGITGE